jgi:hypothetical protein
MNSTFKQQPSIRLLALSAIIALAASCSKSEKTVPVTGIEFKPDKMEIFVGQSLPVTITAVPQNATNTGDLQVSSSKPDIATFENGKVTGVKAGTANLVATCGAVRNTASVKVFWTMSRNGTSYPIKQASGYKYYMGSPEVDSYDVDFSDGSEHFRIWIPAKLLGKTIDISKPLPALTEDWDSCFLNYRSNDYQNDCTIFMQADSNPIIRNSDWDILPLTPSGTFSLNLIPSKGYVADIDIRLSNGHTWKLHYEGPIATEDQGEKS